MNFFYVITLSLPALICCAVLLLTLLWSFQRINRDRLTDTYFFITIVIFLLRLPVMGTGFAEFLFHPLLSLPVIFLLILWIIRKLECTATKRVLFIHFAQAVITVIGAALFASNGTTRGSMDTFMGALITPASLSVLMLSSLMMNNRTAAAISIIITALFCFGGAYYVTYGFDRAEWPSMEGRYSVILQPITLFVVGVLILLRSKFVKWKERTCRITS